ncbi:archease [Actinomadura keratinilytica]|jgi:SHS2 domain-containing protein|uniref:Archease n=1 Tax=Actinomadura keratinilytica TaxID=547461 RepID=A0ABP7YHQ9_9ACTN
MAGETNAASGHRTAPHTADLRIEAWAPTREGCVAEAVAGLVDAFADRSKVPPLGVREAEIGPAADADLLVAALDEVIYRLDAAGELVLAADVAARDGDRLRLRLTVGDARRAEATGAVPKAASLHGLSFAERHGTWACAVTVDV